MELAIGMFQLLVRKIREDLVLCALTLQQIHAFPLFLWAYEATYWGNSLPLFKEMLRLLFLFCLQHYKVMAQVCAGIQQFMDHLDCHYSQNWEKMDFGRSKQQTGWYGSSKVSDAGWTLIPEGWNSMFS